METAKESETFLEHTHYCARCARKPFDPCPEGMAIRQGEIAAQTPAILKKICRDMRPPQMQENE